jgi:CubicO group peptidase (beta-lactamase class C family)
MTQGNIILTGSAMRTTIVVALCLQAMLSAPAAAQAPASPSEQLLRDLVAVMNAGDSTALATFVVKWSATGPNAPSAAQRVASLRAWHHANGTFSIRTVEPGVAEVSALVQSARTEAWRKLTLSLSDESPRRIARIGLAPAPSPTAPTTRPGDAELVAQLRGYVERLAARDAFSGAVLLAKEGKPLYRAAFGEANKDFGVRNTPDTKFNLGSMNKMFTGVAIMQLVEAGKLSLNDSLGKFLPPGSMQPDVLAKVRIKHLLTHTSGLGSYFTAEWDGQSRARYRSVDDWMALVRSETLRFEPGTRWGYSNTGMLVLGKVIEVASGKDYFTYVRERITQPLGMSSTAAYELDRVNTNLAVGYNPEIVDGQRIYRNNIFMHVIRGGPAGGGYSTVDDLTRFAVGLKGGRLVSAQSYQQLTTPKQDLSSPDYGFGFGVSANGRIAGHSGGFPGINSQLDIYLDDVYTVVVMSNYSGGAQPVIEKTRELLLPGRVVVP